MELTRYSSPEAQNLFDEQNKYLSQALENLNRANTLVKTYNWLLENPDNMNDKLFRFARRRFILYALKPDGTKYAHKDVRLPKNHRKDFTFLHKLEAFADQHRQQVYEAAPRFFTTFMAALPPPYGVL